jgi:hypothetical protein
MLTLGPTRDGSAASELYKVSRVEQGGAVEAASAIMRVDGDVSVE